MRFSQKIVAASSALLLCVIALLSFQQLSTVREEIESLVQDSLMEMVKGVKNTIESDLASKKGLAQSTTEILQLDPTNKAFAKSVLESPNLKGSFLAIGLAMNLMRPWSKMMMVGSQTQITTHVSVLGMWMLSVKES